MEFVERALVFVEACHRRLSSFCLKVAGALWAWQGRRSLSFRLAVGFFPLVLVAVWCAYLVSGGYVAAKEFDESLVRYLERAGHLAAGARLAWALLAAAALSLAAMVSALAKKRFSFRLMQAAWAAFAATAALALVWLMRVGSIFVACDHKAFDSGMRNELWTGLLFWGLIAALWTLALLVALLMKGVRRAYGFGDEPLTRDAGERVVAAAKTTVGDRRWKSSLYYAFTIFFLVIFGPYLAFMWGWEEPYGLPAHRLSVYADGRQRGADQAGLRGVVKAAEVHVVGHAYAKLPEHVQHVHGDEVIGADGDGGKLVPFTEGLLQVGKVALVRGVVQPPGRAGDAVFGAVGQGEEPERAHVGIVTLVE